MSEPEMIQQHESAIQAIKERLSAARDEQTALNKRRAEVRNWLAGHNFSQQELEARGAATQYAEHNAELLQLDESLSAAKLQIQGLEEALATQRSASFSAADTLGARLADHGAIRRELEALLQSDAALIAQREAAAKDGACIKDALRVAEMKKAAAMSIDDVTVAGKEVVAASQRQADIQALLRNIDSRLVSNGASKDELRKRLSISERVLWQAQAVHLCELLRSQPWYAECERLLVGSYAASVMAGQAFDLGRYLAGVISGRPDDPRIDPAVINGYQVEMARDLGIDGKV